MINELHSALILRSASSSPVLGEDIADSKWRVPNNLPKEIRQLRNVVITGQTPESDNWRALQIRSLLRTSDLHDFQKYFDPREGYAVSDLLQEMAGYFTPKLSGDLSPGVIAISGRPVKQSYELLRYDIVGAGNSITIRSAKYGTATGSAAGGSFNTYLPGTTAVATVLPFTGNIVLEWASRPQVNIVGLSAAVTADCADLINKVCTFKSIYPPEQLNLLRTVTANKQEPIAQVLAAALIYAGAVLALLPSSMRFTEAK